MKPKKDVIDFFYTQPISQNAACDLMSTQNVYTHIVHNIDWNVQYAMQYTNSYGWCRMYIIHRLLGWGSRYMSTCPYVRYESVWIRVLKNLLEINSYSSHITTSSCKINIGSMLQSSMYHLQTPRGLVVIH